MLAKIAITSIMLAMMSAIGMLYFAITDKGQNKRIIPIFGHLLLFFFLTFITCFIIGVWTGEAFADK